MDQREPRVRTMNLVRYTAFPASEEASALFNRSIFVLRAPNERPRCMHRGRTGDD